MCLTICLSCWDNIQVLMTMKFPQCAWWDIIFSSSKIFLKTRPLCYTSTTIKDSDLQWYLLQLKYYCISVFDSHNPSSGLDFSYTDFCQSHVRVRKLLSGSKKHARIWIFKWMPPMPKQAAQKLSIYSCDAAITLNILESVCENCLHDLNNWN